VSVWVLLSLSSCRVCCTCFLLRLFVLLSFIGRSFNVLPEHSRGSGGSGGDNDGTGRQNRRVMAMVNCVASPKGRAHLIAQASRWYAPSQTRTAIREARGRSGAHEPQTTPQCTACLFLCGVAVARWRMPLVRRHQHPSRAAQRPNHRVLPRGTRSSVAYSNHGTDAGPSPRCRLRNPIHPGTGRLAAIWPLSTGWPLVGDASLVSAGPWERLLPFT